MTDQVPVIYIHDLLCFALIPHIPFVVDTSCIISCSCIMMHPSGHQSECNSASTHPSTNLSKVTLNERCQPPAIYLLCYQISVKCLVPKIVVITSNKFKRVRPILLLHPSDSTLSWACKVITIWEIEPITKHRFDTVQHLIQVWIGLPSLSKCELVGKRFLAIE